MYEEYSKQAMPSKEYRTLLGGALCVFNSNNAFVIENILRLDHEGKYNWYQLIDKTSGRLKPDVKNTILKESSDSIANLFAELVEVRNRIIHSYQITNKDGQQVLATKTNEHKQFIITEEYLFDFFKKNDELSSTLHKLRGY